MEIKHKRKPFNKRRLWQGSLVAAVTGVVFAAAACLVFIIFQQTVLKRIATTKEDNVIIQVGGQETEEIDVTTSALKIRDRQQELYKLYDTGLACQKFVVSIVPGTGHEYEGMLSSDQEVSGIILTQTSDALLILTTPGAMKGNLNAQITFFNGETVLGKVVGTDTETKISVVSVSIASLAEETLSTIHAAPLANSSITKRGQSVVVIGCPLGEAKTMVVGQLISTSSKAYYLDREYTMLETDIVGKSYANGFLVSEDGNILGVISHDEDEADEVLTLRAIGISELTEAIERLCNGEDFPYIGINISTVTKVNAERYHIKEGIFVENVALKSPAAAAGIQRGDIIVGFGKKDITTGKQLYKGLMSMDPGDSAQIRLFRYANGEYETMLVTVVLGTH